jgi:HSP20 family molecular chaperone IbpA
MTDLAKITALANHGVLEIKIPKREAATEKKLKSALNTCNLLRK